MAGRQLVIPEKRITFSFQSPQRDQNGPLESVHASVMEYVGSYELAQQLYYLHTQLFEATDEIELVTQVIGRDQFPGRIPSNLDLLMRRFNEVQYWATTEVLLASPQKRVHTLRKFIKIALYAKENRDLMTLFAITLGLSNVAVSRLTNLWDRLPNKLRRQFAEFESLLNPSRNHRPYRALVSKMSPPMIPFVPLLLKDLTFIHEGNKTYYNGLVNFEKMHMIANILRSFRQCKSRCTGSQVESKKISETQNFIRNFCVVDNQRRFVYVWSFVTNRIDNTNKNVKQKILYRFDRYAIEVDGVIVSNRTASKKELTSDEVVEFGLPEESRQRKHVNTLNTTTR
ncbi:RasGEF domain protein [Dictyocaulus viviparus]|uniref:RasGEF domain protein n=1 Tax=Dictyocaulus viviparus TaxID=29172 RepID=A0A0D8XLI0_DICVI|nr:RasGEF domain protein [Dictyocaulus viviparus]